MRCQRPVAALLAGAVLLLAGCSKQEPAANSSADHSADTPPTAGEKATPAQTPNLADNLPAASAKAAAAALVNASGSNAPAAAAGTTAISNTALATRQPEKRATDRQLMTNATTARSGLATNLTSALKSQQTSLAQTATNQLQALAAAATNGALGLLGATNQAAAMGTNQVQALLERAKALTSNQKYQEALGTVTELYNTKLTPEQKQKADDLKAQIQTAIAEKAAAGASSALGNILGGKK